MKALIFVVMMAAASSLLVTHAMAADLPEGRYPVPAPAPIYMPIYGPTYCRVKTERFFDGYAWRSRDIQVCR